jgi:H+/Cl- antiporter ClcA
MLIVVTVSSLLGWLNKKEYSSTHDKLSLFLLIGAHLQLVIGLVLYFLSPFVKFGSETMKVAETRYWTVEHSLMMIVAIALITVARITSKKRGDTFERHKPMLLLNSLALVVILAAIVMSKRGIL